jgi:Rps23 Pro-64 3,4-dihydroxylase Tpa1-like proline 4-hydroxylase
MTPKQILDSFSETLMRDERILSPQERALVATLLQHAKAATVDNRETQEAVRAVIASAVGETVAQRAFAVLGGSIVERILEAVTLPLGDPAGERRVDIFAGPKNPGEPQPPSQGPGPGVKAPHREPHRPQRDTPVAPPPKEPQPPSLPMGEPQPPSVGPGPHAVRTSVVSETRSAIAARPSVLPAQSVVLDEFLAPQEVEELTRFTLEHEADFSASEVVSPSADGGIVNYEHRRSRALMDLAQHRDLMLARIKAVLPQVLHRLGMEEFSIADLEAQVTASNEGDFFHFHSDNGSDRVASRHLTFVYFFHREPRQFEGGELRIHDARLEEGTYVSEGSYQTIVPQQNQIVFFPCKLMHEITPVNCASQLFADSRFTLNGWLRR